MTVWNMTRDNSKDKIGSLELDRDYWRFGMMAIVQGLTIGLVFSLIIGLDYPFRGDLSVDDDAYVGVGKSAAALFSGEHKTEETKAPA